MLSLDMSAISNKASYYLISEKSIIINVCGYTKFEYKKWNTLMVQNIAQFARFQILSKKFQLIESLKCCNISNQSLSTIFQFKIYNYLLYANYMLYFILLK